MSIYFGEVSFAFYLVQIPVMALLAHFRSWNHSWTEVHSVATVLVAFVASLGAAILLHHVVELPMQRKLRGPGAASIATEDPKEFAAVDEARRTETRREEGTAEPGTEPPLPTTDS